MVRLMNIETESRGFIIIISVNVADMTATISSSIEIHNIERSSILYLGKMEFSWKTMKIPLRL